MARIKVRYFVEKPGKDGSRYFWQPAKALRDLGWPAERLDNDRTKAITRAEELNGQVDAWRQGATVQVGSSPIIPAGGPKPGTVSDLIRRYRASRFFKDKAPKTKRGYDQNLRIIEDWSGEAPVSAIGEKRVQKLYDSLRAKTPAKANAVITMLRILLGHGVREQMVTTNAAAKPGLVSLPQSGKLWPIDAVSLFVETADRMGWHSIGTAVVINHWIGQREGDILHMARAAYRNGRFDIVQRKTGARVSVPHSPWVQRRVDGELRRQIKRKVIGATHLILCETTGQPWKEDHFRHIFADIRAASARVWSTFFLDDDTQVEMVDLQFMHLRHTAVTELAIAGCNTLQIAGITGHTPKSAEQILCRYLVRTSDLAATAIALRLELGTDIAALVADDDEAENTDAEQV